MRLAGITVAALALAFAWHAPARAAELLPLHAVRGEDPRIEDSAGRQVLLRGVNVNQLGDYFQTNPQLPAVVPLEESDFDEMAALGFNVVRLIVSWSALEPERGALDRAYVSSIRRAVRWARERDIYVVLDMHQDAWGKFIATPPGETCAPGFAPNQGWDGAPRWATLTDGLPTCRLGIREIAPAVGQAWQSFWLDRDGIQTALVETWARLSREFAAEPAVAGYDLVNEPNPGYLPGVSDATSLGVFYGRAIDAIRKAERKVPGGFSHIVFFEPGAIWSAAAIDSVPPPTFTADRNLVFAPHLYAESLSATPVSIEQGFELATAVARTYGVTVWSGEWGWFGDPVTDRDEILRYARAEDAHLYGGTWWQWKQACGDPHNFSDGRDTTPTRVSGNINPFACPSGTRLPRPDTTVRILSRATVRSAPGRLERLESEPDTGAFELRGSDPDRAGSCMLVAWVPGRGKPRFDASGVTRLRARRVRGGFRVTGCARGRYELRLTGRAPA